FRENFSGVIATLTGNNDIHLLQTVNVCCIHKCWGSLTTKCRSFTTRITGRKIEWLKMSKIILFNHTLHKDGTYHPAPTDQTYFHVTLPRCVKKSKGIRVYQKGT